MACPAATATTYVHSFLAPYLSSHDISSATVVSTLPPQSPKRSPFATPSQLTGCTLSWAIRARCCLQGSHRGAERTVPVEEREEGQLPRPFHVPAPGPPGPGHEGARRLGAAASASTSLRYRPRSQGHRPRPPARGHPRIRRARGNTVTTHDPNVFHSTSVFLILGRGTATDMAHVRDRTSTFCTRRRRRTSGCRSRAATVGWLLSPGSHPLFVLICLTHLCYILLNSD
jgi:hypothetical protein